MLERLKIWNIGGVREAEINLSQGLNVITGESGAGKSSVVRALELLSGRRSDAQIIRAGEDHGGAEANFITDLNFPELDDACQPLLDDKTLTARRVIKDGRSRASLQGVNVPLSAYSIAAGKLIHIQSQFAQLELLDPEKQLEMIDSRTDAEIKKTALKLREVFDMARDKAAELRQLKKSRAEIEQRYANANEVFNLVKAARPEAGLEKRLENDLSEILHNKSVREKLEENFDKLFGGLSAQGLLSEIKNIFDTFTSENILNDDDKNLLQDINGAINILEDAAEKMRENIFNNYKSDEEYIQEQDEIEKRLGILRRLKRLSGAHDEEELINYCEDAAANLEWLEKSYSELERLSEQALRLKKEANTLALTLRDGRKSAALKLEEAVNNILNDLGMPDTEFKIKFYELNKLKKTGADEVEFLLISGSRSGRVDKIASGGELSRLLLALQLSLPDEWLPQTLVFDEIEAGLGGKAAVLSGLKLKELSQRCQVILVTHEASIAALGDAHINITRVNNFNNLNSDETIIKNIYGEERVREIARMLSGSPDLIEAQEHARKILKI